MATIYDVAKLAGVSIGTVSNYMNQKYVGLEKSRAIKSAIAELHYTPNHTARALRETKLNRIMLILPNITDQLYAEIASTILFEMYQADYQVELQFTNDYPSRELSILSSCLSTSYAAILLCTCMPDQTELFQKISASRPLIFLLRRPDELHSYTFFGFDNYDIITRLTDWLLRAGKKDIRLWTGPTEFSCERACVKAFAKSFENYESTSPIPEVTSLPISREIIFRNATKMFTSGHIPHFIITSNKLIADAIMEAAYYQNIILEQNICIISLGDGKWSNIDQLYFNMSTTRSVKSMAQEAAKCTLEYIASPLVYENVIRQIRDDFSEARLETIVNAIKPLKISRIARPSSRKIRIIATDHDTGVLSIQSLIPWISECIDTDIEMDLVPMDDIMKTLLKEKEGDSYSYDLLHLDNPWMEEAASRSLIKDITDYFEHRPTLKNALIPDLVESTATVRGRIYGVPSLLCSQMLFYRKDLFNDPVCQNSFTNTYGKPLQPPTTWFDYRLIAEFFTRSYNPDSPCGYGTIMGTATPEMMLTEVMPRIWSYGGDLFDDSGNVTLYSEENLQAIRNFLSCLKCADPIYPSLHLPQFPEQFARGSAAMMIGYDIHASRLLDYNDSNVLDKIGFAPVPGGFSTKGGWNFCINSKSDKTDLCYKFLDWILSPDMATPYTLLGGGSPRKNIVSSPEVVSMYPWMEFTSETFKKSRMRHVPANSHYVNPSERDVEQVLADAIFASIDNVNLLPQHLKTAEQKIIAMRKPIISY